MSIQQVCSGERPWLVDPACCQHTTALMPAACVQTVVCSPPYFQLRKYKGVTDTPWPEVSYTPMSGLDPISVPAMSCCLGREPTPAAFVAHLVLIFRAVRRVLHPSGTLWVNLGDSFAGGGGGNHGTGKSVMSQGGEQISNVKNKRAWLEGGDMKAKDMLMVPSRFALAMQADGWYLRQVITWAKLSPLPESVTDRPTTATESIFLFSQSPRYFYDRAACLVPHLTAHDSRNRPDYEPKRAVGIPEDNSNDGRIRTAGPSTWPEGGRNLWSWWEVDEEVEDEDGDEEDTLLPQMWKIASEPQKVKHYASFPSEIARRAIKLGTSAHGCCRVCFAPWQQQVKKRKKTRKRPNDLTKRTGEDGTGNFCPNSVAGVTIATLGWQATCSCPQSNPIGCLVYDPFCGSGTTGIVARQLGRRFVGSEISPDYAAISVRRIGQAMPLADCIDQSSQKDNAVDGLLPAANSVNGKQENLFE